MNAPANDPQVAEVINLSVLCEKLHCLPKPGGLYDQDSYTVKALTMVFAAQAERERQESERTKRGAKH